MKKFITFILIGCVIALLSYTKAQSQTPPSGFVYAQDSTLMKDGNTFYFSGTNNYYMMYKPKEMVLDILDAAVELNLKAIRIWGFMNGTNVGNEGIHDGYSIQRFAGQYDSTGLHKIDSLVYLAAQRDLKLVITLVNYWDEFGGMREYVNWAKDQGESVTYPNSFYTNNVCKQLFKDYVKHFITRTNHLTGVAYKDDPTIMAWQLTNEARSTDQTGQIVADWTEEMADFIKGIDPWHMVSLGDEGGFAYPNNHFPGDDELHRGGEYIGSFGTDWLKIAEIDNIDYLTLHNYGTSWWNHDIPWTIEWVRYHIQEGHKINKPVILEEYGKRIDGEFNDDKDQLRFDVMNPQQEVVYEKRAAGDFSWMLTGVNTWDPISSEKNLYRDRWPDGFQYTKYDKKVGPMIANHGERMYNLNITTPPEAFSQVVPASNSTQVSVLPLLSWEKATGGTQYDLIISENSNLSNPVVAVTDLRGNTYEVVDQLAFEKKYYWQITAKNHIGQTVATNAGMSFTTQTEPPLPGTFTLLSPENDQAGLERGGITFTWEASQAADKYELMVATDEEFTNVAANVTGIFSTEYTAEITLAYSTTYYWRVTAKNITGDVTSPVSGFQTLLPPSTIDNFESYADCESISTAWVQNSGGGEFAVCIETSDTQEASQSMRITYNFDSYAGARRSINRVWTGYEGIAFWVKPDGTGKDLTLQFKEPVGDYDGEYWESIQTLSGTDWQEIFIPFSAFNKPSWNNTGDGVLSLSQITEIAIYLGGSAGSGTILIDNIHLITSEVVPPVAHAGTDQTLTDTNNDGVESVVLDGSGSSDADGSIASYKWTQSGGQIATGVNPTVNLGIGEHSITLQVTDSDGNVASDAVVIIVKKAEADPLSPVAGAGSDQMIVDTDNSGSETVTLDGSGSSDQDGTITSYVWIENGNQIATGVNPTVNLSLGEHSITLQVTDNDGDTATDIVTITITAPITNENLALNKPVSVSSNDNWANGAQAAVDNNMNTRWSSNYNNNEWIYVDLGQTYNIHQVILRWEAAYGQGYEIQVATNTPNQWTTVFTETGGNGNEDVVNISPVAARYVRMHGLTRGTQWGYSLWEMEIYGNTTTATSLKTYPNPINLSTQVVVPISQEETVEVSIYDESNGIQVFHRDNVKVNAEKEIDMDFSVLPSGKYMLVVVGKNGRWTTHLVKDK